MEYWKKRIEAEEAVRSKQDKAVIDELDRLRELRFREIEKEIDSFYRRYAEKERITVTEAKKRVKAMDVQAFADKAKEYVRTKDFSPRANEELRLYNLKMRVQRLELLKNNIDLELLALGSENEKIIARALNHEAIREINLQSGILGESVMTAEELETAIKALIDTPYSGAVWSERLWGHMDDLRGAVKYAVEKGILEGKGSREIMKLLRQQFSVSGYIAKRLAVTEMARMQTAIQKESYLKNGYDMVEYIASSDEKTCKVCGAMDGKIFPTVSIMPGTNASPMHPFCRCSLAPSVTHMRKELDEILNNL